MYQGRHGGDCDECEGYPPQRSEGDMHTSHIDFLCPNWWKKSIACERVVSPGQSSVGQYEHFACWSERYKHFALCSGRYEYFRPLKLAVWTFRPIALPRCNWLHTALRASMQCDFFRPFGHKRSFAFDFSFGLQFRDKVYWLNVWSCSREFRILSNTIDIYKIFLTFLLSRLHIHFFFT